LATEGLAALSEFGNAPPLVLLGSMPLLRLRLAQGDVAAAEGVLAELRALPYAPYPMVELLLEAAEARVRLARGDGAAAVAWAASVEPPPRADLLRFGAAAVEAAAVTPARVLIVQGRDTGDSALLQQAQRYLEVAGQLADEQGLGWLRLRVSILRALLADARGDRQLALESLAAAVAQAETENVIRPFLDEGEPMAALLAALHATGGTSPAFIGTLFTGGPPGAGLTERELEVLRLLAAGHSTADLAAALFVEQSTVKTHLIHLYRKLGVRSRTQAAARARALRLLN
jgi:LuxR family transcriptional regulator, maltose regulon positive regulatory protein